jgi:hypothetical protein
MSKKTIHINPSMTISIDCSAVPEEFEDMTRNLLIQAFNIGYATGVRQVCETISDAIKQHGTVKRKETLTAIKMLCENILNDGN